MELVEDHIFEGLNEARANVSLILLAQVTIGGEDQGELGSGETVDATKG